MTTSASYTYQFRLDPAETVRASKHVLRRQPLAWVNRVVWISLVGLAVLFLATGAPRVSFGLLSFSAVVLLGLHFLGPWWQRRQLRRAYAETPGLREPQVYHLRDSGLTMAAGPASVILEWEAVIEASETDEFILFYFSKNCAYYLPKHAIGDTSEQHRLRGFLRERLGERARGLAVAPA